jgi:hypothetical protein
MLNEFSADYSARSDDELLVLASDRGSLTTEAAAALEAELHRRKLTEVDQAEHEQFVRRSEQREAKRRRRKIFGTRRNISTWVDLFWGLMAIALIWITYLALPSRYHMKSDWQEAATDVMFVSVFIAVASNSLWRTIAFWISLAIASAIELLVVHAWIQRFGNFSRWEGKLGVLVGFGLFLVAYAIVLRLQRTFSGEEASENPSVHP